MRYLDRILDAFSRRSRSTSRPLPEIPEQARTRIVHFCRDVFSNTLASYSSGDYSGKLWEQMHRFLQMRHGVARLAPEHKPSSPAEDVVAFLLFKATEEEFLDLVEYLFRIDAYFHVSLPDHEVIDGLNKLFRFDGLPYHVTNFVREEEPDLDGSTLIRTVAYPQVILRENEAVHELAVEPALQLLEEPAYQTAHEEFLEGLEDYRKGDYGNALTKCASSLESVMKILCSRHEWPYDATHTAKQLVNTILANTALQPYFEPALMIVATLRNRLSKSHGAGIAPRRVPQHLARYAIAVTAASILLLVQEAEPKRRA